MGVRQEIIPFAIVALVIGAVLCLLVHVFGVDWSRSAWAGGAVATALIGYLLYFFRDPERRPPGDPQAIVAGADGVVMAVTPVRESQYLKTETVRISIFLSLFDVHVNRSPIEGRIQDLQNQPGKRFFTFKEESSEHNQRNSILIEGKSTACLVNQIAGPVARRVVYWLELGQNIAKGERIGMMKFGSRLDMYFPVSDVAVTAQKGDRVHAGETVVAKLKAKASP